MKNDGRDDGLLDRRTPGGPDSDVRYRKLPLPDDWLRALDPLCPALVNAPGAACFPQVALSESGEVIDAFLQSGSGLFAARNAAIVWQRVARDRPVRSVASEYGVSFQRAVQIQQAMLGWSSRRGRWMLEAVRARLDPAGTVVHVSGRGVVHPAATPAEQWRMLAALLRLDPVGVCALPGDRVFFGPACLPAVRGAEDLLRAEPRFWPLAELAQVSGCPVRALVFAGPLGRSLRVTRGERVMLADWTLPQLMTAVALEWRSAGVSSWHFSQMLRAVNLVDPRRNSGHRNVAAAVRSAAGQPFASAGRQGHWCLAGPAAWVSGALVGDSCAAIVPVLEVSDLPLHVKVVQTRPGPVRDLDLLTLQAALWRDAAFFNSGRNVFGPPGRTVPPLPEETWAAEHLAALPGGALAAAAMHLAVREAGFDPERLETIDPERLETIDRSSERVALRGQVRRVYRAVPETPAYDRWFRKRDRSASPLPPEVLRAGLSHLRPVIRDRQVTQLLALYRLRGWPVPPELTGEVTWEQPAVLSPG